MKIKKTTKISVIGQGNFGRLLAELLAKYFDEVSVYDRKSKKAEAKNIKSVSLKEASESEIVILAVSISAMKEVLEKINPYLVSGSLLVDVCSVKEKPARLMSEIIKKDVRLLATHPMWGPESVKVNKGIEGLKIVLWPLRLDKRDFNDVKKILGKLKFEAIEMSPAEHDRQVANSQVLAQFTGKILEKMPIKDVDIATKGYDHLQKLLQFVSTNSRELFYSLQNENPQSPGKRKKFIKTALDLELKIINERKEEIILRGREKIDFLDEFIFYLLKKRMEVSKEIGQEKKKKTLAVVDKKREEKIIKEKIKKTKLNKNFVQDFYRLIFKESYKKQRRDI